MGDPNQALFEAVVRLLTPVLDELVFVGGCTTGLFLTDPAAGGVRPTKDVDAIVDVASYAGYASLADRLRALGLVEDTRPGAPLCRWRQGEMVVDVMPTDAQVLGFSNRWYPAALATAELRRVVDRDVRLVTPVFFLATKLEAYRGRGGGDVSASHDLEDIVTVANLLYLNDLCWLGGRDSVLARRAEGAPRHDHRTRCRPAKRRNEVKEVWLGGRDSNPDNVVQSAVIGFTCAPVRAFSLGF